MKRRQRILEDKFKEIAQTHGVDVRTVTEVEDSMWRMVKELINQTDNENEIGSNIYLRFLGTVFVPPGKIARIKERIEKKKDNGE